MRKDKQRLGVNQEWQREEQEDRKRCCKPSWKEVLGMQLSSGEKVYTRGILGKIWVYRVFWRKRQRFSGVYPEI